LHLRAPSQRRLIARFTTDYTDYADYTDFLTLCPLCPLCPLWLGGYFFD